MNMPTTTLNDPLLSRPARTLATHPAGPTAVDRLMLGMLTGVRRLAGIRIERVDDARGLDAANSVARAVLGDHEARIPTDLLHVEARYASMAVVFVAWHRRRPVGTVTLYLPTVTSRTLESAPVALPPAASLEGVVELGRLAILPTHRGGARLVLLGLFEATQRLARRTGRPWWIGMTSPGLIRVFPALNPTTRPLPTGVIDAQRPADVVRYGQAYRAGNRTLPQGFILESEAAVPRVVLPRHVAGLARPWWRALKDGRSGSRG